MSLHNIIQSVNINFKIQTSSLDVKIVTAQQQPQPQQQNNQNSSWVFFYILFKQNLTANVTNDHSANKLTGVSTKSISYTTLTSRIDQL